jgi:hypothetical protein
MQERTQGWQRGETVAIGIASLLATLAVAILLDGTVRPRRRALSRWRWQGLAIHLLAATTLFGCLLAASGSSPVAAGITIASIALATVTSNAKFAMLGEPLVFSDLALIIWVFRHPRFYLTAISARQRAMLAIAAPLVVVALAALFVSRPAPHLAGLGLGIFAAGALLILLRSAPITAIAREPDLETDLPRFGLIATLLLYWLRWRATSNPQPCAVPLNAEATVLSTGLSSPELIVVVQCESFADPADLTRSKTADLPGLARARARAWQWGNLEVSGFGAYTMRTEYGVLFGRSEAALGFRRYDPFLTAHGEISYALPAKLASLGYHRLFVHPHDMRFYGRDLLMPAIGFDHLIGEEQLAPDRSGRARYMNDRALGDAIGTIIDRATGPTLVYAVTMENHGPWIKEQHSGSPGGFEAYLHHVGSSDTMLTALIDRLSKTGRSALLVFFGDHRPSIPGIVRPGGGAAHPLCRAAYFQRRSNPAGFQPTDRPDASRTPPRHFGPYDAKTGGLTRHCG